MLVKAGLFENNAFLVAQHMARYAITGEVPRPMPVREPGWGIYDVFSVKDGEQIFLAAVSDAQFAAFCKVLGFADLAADPAYATNNDRVRARAPLLAVVRERLAQRSAAEIAALFEEAGLPFAPIRRPEELYDDPHLRATGGLADIVVPDGAAAGQRVKTTLSPITLDGARLPVRANPPRAGEHTDEILAAIGYSHDDVARLRARGVVD